MRRRGVLATSLLPLLPRLARATPPPLLVFGTQSGQPAFDSAAGGGNPFASALVEALGRRALALAELLPALAKRTAALSGGRQRPDVSALAARPEAAAWRLDEGRRVALVVVWSSYPAGSGAEPLPGAALDARRVAAALTATGWEVTLALDPTRTALPDLLEGFAHRAEAAEAALLYTTGHGVEDAGEVLLIPPDFPLRQGSAALPGHAVPLRRLAAALRARSRNLALYAGCRDNPFAAGEAAFRAGR